MSQRQREVARRLNEMAEQNRIISMENRRKKELIEKEAKERGIKIEKLDKRINNSGKTFLGGLFGLSLSLLCLGGVCFIDYLTVGAAAPITNAVLVNALNNIATCLIAGTFTTGGIGALTSIGSGAVYAGTKIQKLYT